MNKEEWKSTPAYGFYDYRLVQKVIRHLQSYRGKDDPESANHLKDVLYACLKQNFAGIENAKLYSNTYLGTKYLIDDYVDEGNTKNIHFCVIHSDIISPLSVSLSLSLSNEIYGRFGAKSPYQRRRQAIGIPAVFKELWTICLLSIWRCRIWLLSFRCDPGAFGRKSSSFDHYWNLGWLFDGCYCVYKDR